MRLTCLKSLITYNVDDWFTKEQGITSSEVVMERETEGAYLFNFGDDVKKFIPKSLCKVVKHDESLNAFLG